MVNKGKELRFRKLREIFKKCHKTRKIFKKILPYRIRVFWGQKIVDAITLQDANRNKITLNRRKQLKRNFKDEVEKINKLLNEEGFIDKDLVKYWGYKGIK